MGTAINDSKLSDEKKLELIEQNLRARQDSQTTEAERNVFTVMNNSSSLPAKMRFELIKEAMAKIQSKQPSAPLVSSESQLPPALVQMPVSQEALQQYNAVCRSFSKCQRMFKVAKGPTEEAWNLYDEVTAAFNSLKFMEGVNQLMRVDIDEKLETLKAFNP